MAITVNHVSETPSGATKEQSVEAGAVGDIIVAFASQSASTAQPTFEDLLSQTWTVQETHAVGNTSTGSVWVAICKRTQTGGTTVIVKPGAGGATQGISVIELSGASTTVDVINKKDNAGSVKTVTSESTTTTDAGDIVLAAVGACAVGAMGLGEAWTGTGPMTAMAAFPEARCQGGYYVPGSTLSGATFTLKWPTSRQVAMLVLAVKPAAAGGNTVKKLEASLTFAGALGRNTTHQLPASLTFQGALARNTALAMVAVLSFAGALGRTTATHMVAALTFAGALARKTTRQLAATLSFVGAFTAQQVGKYVKRMEATLSFAGNLERRTTRQLPATLTFQGALSRNTARAMKATLTFTGRLGRNTTRAMTATLTFAGTLGRRIAVTFKAVLGLVGGLTTRREGEPEGPTPQQPTSILFATHQTAVVLVANQTRAGLAPQTTIVTVNG